MKKLIALFLTLCLLALPLMGCGEQAAAPTAQTADTTAATAATQTATEPTLDAESQAILQARRDQAEAYMRKMATLLWRCGETVEYHKSNAVITLVEGRLYRGIPYTHACAGYASFAGFGNSHGEVLNVSGLSPDLLGNSLGINRLVGNDCSGAVQTSWAQLGGDFTVSITGNMAPDKGFVRIGSYYAPDSDNKSSKVLCSSQDAQVLFSSYALLQKADAVVRYNNGSGHVMMSVENHPVYLADGTIDGAESYITVLHQTSRPITNEDKYFDEALGEDVYIAYGVDEVFTYDALLEEGYLPISCPMLVDASIPVAEPTVTDSLEQPTAQQLLEGSFTSNYLLSFVDLAITDSEGATVQHARAFTQRDDPRTLALSEFNEPSRIMGSLDLDALAPGSYTATFTAQLITEETFTVRTVTLTVE